MLAALICGPKPDISALLFLPGLRNQFSLSLSNNDWINVIFVLEDDAKSR
jgi:hypothetical protein